MLCKDGLQTTRQENNSNAATTLFESSVSIRQHKQSFVNTIAADTWTIWPPLYARRSEKRAESNLQGGTSLEGGCAVAYATYASEKDAWRGFYNTLYTRVAPLVSTSVVPVIHLHICHTAICSQLHRRANTGNFMVV